MFKNFIKFSFGSWIAAGISFFTTPIVTLLIMPEEFGKAAMFTLANSILIQIVLAGGDQGFLRFFYEECEDKRTVLLWNAIYPAIIFLVIVSMVMLLFWKSVSYWLIGDNQILIVAALSVNLLIAIFNRYASLVIRMQKKGVFFSIQRIIQSSLSVIFILCFCHFVSKSFYAIIFSTIFSVVFTTIISIMVERRFWFSQFSIDLKAIQRILKYGLPFAPACLISILFEGIDKMFLREHVGFEELGIYTAAFKIIALLSIVQNGFSMFWTPVSFEHYAKSPSDTSLYERIFHYMLFVMIVLGLIAMAFKDVIILLFAKNYREAASIMPFLLFVPILYTLTEISCLGIYFKKKSGWQLIIFCILLICSIIFNYFLTLYFGVKGTAVAVALSYLVYFYLRTIVSIKLYPMKFQFTKIALSFLLLFIVAGINTFVNNKFIGITCASVAAVIYLSFHMSTIKEILLYFNQNIISSKNKHINEK
jgi:O-antigen/teichoic acid export membrane protein